LQKALPFNIDELVKSPISPPLGGCVVIG